MAAHAMNRLRGKANVPHDGDVDVGDAAHRRRNGRSALELDRLGRALLDEAAGVAQRFLRAHLIREEGHVRDQQRARARAGDCARMVDDLVDGDGECSVLAANRRREAVADQDGVDAGLIEDAREGVVVSGQHRNWLPP
jgi:hypothetical protein